MKELYINERMELKTAFWDWLLYGLLGFCITCSQRNINKHTCVHLHIVPRRHAQLDIRGGGMG